MPRAIKGGMVYFVDDPINKCHDRAAGKGYTVFAVESDDECYTAADAEETYKKHGASNNCHDGVGGIWTLDVYKIVHCPAGILLFLKLL